MGQCVCRRRASISEDPPYSGGDNAAASTSTQRRSRHFWRPGRLRAGRNHVSRLAGLGGGRDVSCDIKELILETLAVIRTLTNNEQEPPQAMLKLNFIADRETGWLQIVTTMIEIIPIDNPLGPAVITLFLDESPLPTTATVGKLLFQLDLTPELSHSDRHPPTWHRNACIVLGCIAEKLAGPNSVATFKSTTLEYLLANLNTVHESAVILFSMVALEKYAQTSENKSLILRRLAEDSPSLLRILESWLNARSDYMHRQIGFCAQWALDNLFVEEDRAFGYEIADIGNVNVMLNHNDVSEYLKIAPNGLEARCDVSSFESVRCTFEITQEGVWFYEARIVTSGVMQIGWATRESKFLNHDGYGIGDDEFSVAYDGCRQLLWYNATSKPHSHRPWKPGDVLGCLLDTATPACMFYLNGVPLKQPHKAVFGHTRSSTGFFAAASFMSFQQCEFNFGSSPFAFPPPVEFSSFNEHATLTDEQRLILPRHKKLEILRLTSVPENCCSICCSNTANTALQPCGHDGFCAQCALQLELCPLCRNKIERRVEVE